jgi:excisionase family DNA binding protein
MTKIDRVMDKNQNLDIGELLTIDELASILKTKEKTIRQWVYQGRIPSIKVNGLLRFGQREIQSWLSLGSRRGGQAC